MSNMVALTRAQSRERARRAADVEVINNEVIGLWLKQQYGMMIGMWQRIGWSVSWINFTIASRRTKYFALRTSSNFNEVK